MGSHSSRVCEIDNFLSSTLKVQHVREFDGRGGGPGPGQRQGGLPRDQHLPAGPHLCHLDRPFDLRVSRLQERHSVLEQQKVPRGNSTQRFSPVKKMFIAVSFLRRFTTYLRACCLFLL